MELDDGLEVFENMPGDKFLLVLQMMGLTDEEIVEVLKESGGLH
jgi:hypothetical protein